MAIGLDTGFFFHLKVGHQTAIEVWERIRKGKILLCEGKMKIFSYENLLLKFFLVLFLFGSVSSSMAGNYIVEKYEPQLACNGTTLFSDNSDPDNPKIVEIDMKGNVFWKYDVPDALFPDFREKFNISRIHNQGWMHVNAVSRLKNGNTFISIRNCDMLIEVDSRGKKAWEHSFPSPYHPHDPEVLKSSILTPITSVNMVLEIDKNTHDIIWKWEHPNGKRPIAHIRDANRLPNGNTLIVEAYRIKELTPDGRLVWQVFVPSISNNPRRFKFLFKAQRILD